MRANAAALASDEESESIRLNGRERALLPKPAQDGLHKRRFHAGAGEERDSAPGDFAERIR